MRKYFLPLIALTFLLQPFGLFAQGLTSGAINGRVTQASGEALPGATIKAVHNPTGSVYGNLSNDNGYFRISNMQVGGPYTVTISFSGNESYVKENIYVRLGQAYQINAQMEEKSTELEAVELLAYKNDIFDGNKTGSETVITEEQISATPTVARAIGDFVRLTPQATVREGNDGFSISLNGMNNRYNAIYFDGAVNNDVFGLAGSGTNGGQTGVSPISVDAIEELTVSLQPFDVRIGGFAGGAINAVTRSGTNNWEASAYGFFRNQALAGKTPTNNDTLTRTQLDDFTSVTTGFRVGGPIIKDKLFFFLNAELQRDEIPLPFNFTDYRGDASESDLAALESKLNGFGYDPGTYTNNRSFLNSNKITAKLNYNINENHKLVLRHSLVNAENLEGVQSNSTNIAFLNSSEYFVSNTNSTALELNSIFGTNMSNKAILGITLVRDDRDPFEQDFPFVVIEDGLGEISFGSEEFSTANALDQDVITFTDNFELYLGQHNLTFGTHNEFYNVYNLFIPFNFGSYEYNNLQDFLGDSTANFYIRSYSLVDNITGDGSAAAADFTAGQVGFYVQDEYQVTPDFKLTGGLRIDIPIFANTPVNQAFNDSTIPLLEQFYDLQGAQTGQFIDPQIMFSPRIGFNYDITGENKIQVRGGTGLFTSRVPLVWPGGAFNNYGLNRGTYLGFSEIFNPDPNNQPPGQIDPNVLNPSGDIDLFASDFKVPQVWKTSLNLDYKLPQDYILNVGGSFNKMVNNVAYQNVNLRPAERNLPGNGDGTGDTRPVFDRSDEIDPTYSRILLGYNTNLGYTYNINLSLAKTLEVDQKGSRFTGQVNYSYGDAYTVFDGTSSQNSSQWRGLHAVNGRNTDQSVARSDFAQGHRVVAFLSHKQVWNESKNFATTLSLVYEAGQGQPFSFIYDDNGRLQNEDSRERSLVYIPVNQSEINLIDYTDNSGNVVTAATQWENLNSFIEQNDYLKENRGGYAERNAQFNPFYHVLDLKFLQDFTIMAGNKSHTFQLSLDIFNFTNLLNPDWGRRYFTGSFGNYELIRVESNEPAGSIFPEFTYRGPASEDDNAINDIDDAGIQSSRWQMQVGLRYILK